MGREMRDARNEDMNRIRQQKPSKSVSTSLKFIRSLPVCNGIRVGLVNPRLSMEARRFTKNGSQSCSVRRRKWVSTLPVGIHSPGENVIMTTYSLLSLRVHNLSRWRSALTRCNRGGWLPRYLARLARPAVAEGGRLSGEGKARRTRIIRLKYETSSEG